jgi:hypothetical protein
MIKMHRNSIVVALCELFPEYPWSPWIYDRVPYSFWNNEDNVEAYLR